MLGYRILYIYPCSSYIPPSLASTSAMYISVAIISIPDAKLIIVANISPVELFIMSSLYCLCNVYTIFTFYRVSSCFEHNKDKPQTMKE